MSRKPSNTREQCAFDSGAFKARMIGKHTTCQSKERWSQMRDERNPHKKGSVEHQFWNEGFDNA